MEDLKKELILKGGVRTNQKYVRLPSLSITNYQLGNNCLDRVTQKQGDVGVDQGKESFIGKIFF